MKVGNVRRLIAAASLGLCVSAALGCAKKDDQAKPANSDYYTGPVKEKAKQDNTKKAVSSDASK